MLAAKWDMRMKDSTPGGGGSPFESMTLWSWS
jgi:hypothetical protein